MTPAQARDSYRRSMVNGETVTLRRAATAYPNIRARAVNFSPEELIGGVEQGERKLIVLAEDLVSAAFPLPIQRGDKIVLRGKVLNIEDADDSTRRIAGELIAIDVRALG